MKRSKHLALACSAALVGAWATQGVADERKTQQQSQDKQTQTQTNQQSAQKSGQQSASKRIEQKAGQPTNVIVAGKVTDARDVSLASTAGDKHRLLKVQPPNGQEIIVDIGASQPGQANMNFKKGDRIVAMGKPARINGQPVLFAANVAEMQRVGRTGDSDMSKSSSAKSGDQSSSPQGTAQSSGSQRTAQSSGSQRTAQSGSQGTAGASKDGYDAVIYLFETDNLAQDEYGVYDEDFAWETNDRTFDSWNNTDAVAWDSGERAHYGLLGYDDAGEEGLWDW